MKKSILLVVFFSFLLVACGEKKPKVKEADSTTQIENQDVETSAIDSLANKIEKAKDDIEEAAKEVDQLLEEL